MWSKLDDLDFADDIVLTPRTKGQIHLKVKKLSINSKATGLKVDSEKANLLRLNFISNETVQVDEQDIADLTWVHTSACQGAGRRILSFLAEQKAAMLLRL